MTDRKCPGCGATALERGFVYVRNSDTPTLFDFASWVPGAPEQQLEVIGAAKAPQYRLEPHRCSGCGLLSWFAPTASAWRR